MISTVDRAQGEPVRLVASIESARALWSVGEIAGWSSEYGKERGGQLSALLVSASCIHFPHMLKDRSLLQKIVSISFTAMLRTTLGLFPDARSSDCADTSIIRTHSRQELLYTRSKIAVASKAFGLEAIDMVCPVTCHSYITHEA